jgi:hypothetical protein
MPAAEMISAAINQHYLRGKLLKQIIQAAHLKAAGAETIHLKNAK